MTGQEPRSLVIGGAGFLGRHLAATLAVGGHRVTVLDDLSCENSSLSCAPLQHAAITRVEGSIFDRPLLRELVEAHQNIVHFASVVGVEETIARPRDTIRNLEGTLFVAECLRSEHAVLFGSSADVYGLHSHLHEGPMAEDDLVVFESAEVNRWVYPKVKALEEKLMATTPARCVNVRIFNSYGADMDHPEPKRVVPHFLRAMALRQPLEVSGDGEQRRSLCSYEDTIRGLCLALAHAQAAPPGYAAAVNIGAPWSMSVNELAALMLRLAILRGHLDDPLPIQHGAQLYTQSFDDSWHRSPDLSRAEALFGYRPQVRPEVGLARTIDGYFQRFAHTRSPAGRVEASPTVAQSA